MTIVLYAMNVKGSLLLGIIIAVVAGIPLGVTQMPAGIVSGLDFSTFGAQIDGASFDGERLSFLYSYYAKRRGRAMEVVEIAVQPEEAEKARAVLAHLGLPEVETVQQQLEARKRPSRTKKRGRAREARC